MSMMLEPASSKVARLGFGAVAACAVTLLLVGSGLLTSAAMATEVDRNGGFLNKQCGAERHGCSWCTTNRCFAVRPSRRSHRPPCATFQTAATTIQ